MIPGVSGLQNRAPNKALMVSLFRFNYRKQLKHGLFGGEHYEDRIGLYNLSFGRIGSYASFCAAVGKLVKQCKAGGG